MNFEIKLNVLKLKGSVLIKIFMLNINIKFRIKNGYIYLYFNKKEHKEKLTNKNFNIKIVLELFKQLYFRQQIEKLNVTSNFGFILNSCTTAVICGYLQLLTKSVLCKVKNNKKTAHIFVNIEPKYNEDIFNYKVQLKQRSSGFDFLFSVILAIINLVKDKLQANNKITKYQ